ncbi:PREDICTED: E3 ubiquitin-protein ligase ATL23-like [Ipomoea nil]|uniref:E3 ubiquitin-protein ligase ATL23-like n=1 Tax=Ipomoea nil TaxID=35883 RepID=UPI00090138F8|nr:PREDICTED: E3 ubiquitin-protein ligase ATL23-like [Ipomoea nil]
MSSSGVVGLVLLLCVTILALSLVYIWSFCYLTKHRGGGNAGEAAVEAVKDGGEMGLTAAQLERLPRIRGDGLAVGNDCAVCLDGIESDQVARMVPGCKHVFHLQCADTWLSKHSACPLCRSKIEPELLDPSEDSPC